MIGEEQRVRVDLSATAGLRVRLEPGTPCTAFDFASNFITDFSHALEIDFHPASDVQVDEAIERDPTHQAGMGVMPALVAIFPHAMVGLTPVFADKLAALPEHLLHFTIELPILKKMSDGFDDLAVSVELDLLAGGVAETDGTRTRVAGEMIERAFVGRAFAINIVEDPQLRPRQSCSVQQPVYERLGIVLIAETEKRTDGESGVTQPGEAVIPIVIAPNFFRQRSCRRRDDGARGRKGKEFKHERAACDRLTARSAVI